jgi:hypothetical protein
MRQLVRHLHLCHQRRFHFLWRLGWCLSRTVRA